jgi:hypothetical protein
VRWRSRVGRVACSATRTPFSGTQGLRDSVSHLNRRGGARCADSPLREYGRIRPIARRTHDGQPDICNGCFQPPSATCSRCGRRRPCSFATGPAPVFTACAPRTVRYARFGAEANRAYLTRGGGHYIHAEKLRHTNTEAGAALARAGR